MFISHKFKFVFLEVPRTGSTSISRLMAKLDPESPTALARKQNPGANYHHFVIPEGIPSNYAIVAAHRNPYHRVRSFWKHRTTHGNPEMFKGMSWKRYMKWVMCPQCQPVPGAMKDIPITEMFDPERVTHWLAFDHIDKDWQALSYILEIPDTPLDRLNASSKKPDAEDHWTVSMRMSFHYKFIEDFKRFGYDSGFETGDKYNA